MSQNPALNFALLFVLLPEAWTDISYFTNPVDNNIYKKPNNKMAESGAHQSQLSTAFNYLNDNFCCENTPVHQIVVSYLCFLLFKSESVL